MFKRSIFVVCNFCYLWLINKLIILSHCDRTNSAFPNRSIHIRISNILNDHNKVLLVPISQTVFDLLIEILKHFVLFYSGFLWCNQVIHLRMTQHCFDICKTGTWSDDYLSRKSNRYTHKMNLLWIGSLYVNMHARVYYTISDRKEVISNL